MSEHPANWYADPDGRHELRYWDGQVWTHHVSDGGITAVDPADARTSRIDRFEDALTVGKDVDPATVQAQVTAPGRRGAGIDPAAVEGSGRASILDAPILVVNQKVKIIELNNQYRVFDQHGTQLAAVNQVGQSAAKKALRLVSSLDQFMTHRFEVTDLAGQVLLRLTRPRKVIKSTVIVTDGADRELGRIVQEKMVGKIDFGLESGGQRLGAIKAENWRAWNFRIEDAAGVEVARITKTWEGLAKTMFTTADNYVVQVHRRMAEPLNSLIVAAALSVDTALKQDSRGLS